MLVYRRIPTLNAGYNLRTIQLCLYKKKEFLRFCCCKFSAQNKYKLTPKDYTERILLSGFCPQCNSWVLELHKRTVEGHWTCQTFKRKKATNLFKELENEILGEYTSIKYGNKSNMGFVFGENRLVGNEIRQYSVDFNGKKKLVKTLNS